MSEALDPARLDAILAKLPPEDAAYVAPRLLLPCQLRARRLADRDAAIRAALPLLGKAPGTPAAAELQRVLARYLDGPGWRLDRPLAALPDDAASLRRLLHRIARTNEGHGLGWRQVLRIAAGERTPGGVIFSGGDDTPDGAHRLP